MVVGLLAGLGLGSITSLLSTIQIRTSRAAFNHDPVVLLSLTSYADAYRLNHISQSDYYQYARELGYSTNQAKLAFNNTREFLTGEQASIRRISKGFESVLNHYNTDPDTEYNQNGLDSIKEEYCRAMYKQGFNKGESEKLFESLRPIPTFSVLLEWLAKEVFEPELRTRFRLDEDYPLIWDSLMKSLGVPEQEARNYWASHWLHPSPGQIGDMYTRFRSDRTDFATSDIADAGATFSEVAVSTDDFNESLKLHEIAPFWQKRIIATSFRPLPLTVLQGAYVFGLQNDDWFRGRLRDYGYSFGHAEFILSFWRRKFPYASKAPLSSNVLLQLRRGEINLTVAIATLTDLGIPADAATFVCQLAEEKKEFGKERMRINSWKKLYSKDNISTEKLFEMITASGSNPERASEIVEIIKTAKDGVFSRVRIRDIRTGFKDGKITREEAVSKLEDIRAYSEDIDFILKVYAPDGTVSDDSPDES